MVAYKLKLMHDRYDTIHLYPMKQNTNAYNREENNCGDNSIMFFADEGHVCDTVIDEKT